MLNLLSHLSALLHAPARDRARLAAENVLLRQQLAVLQRSVKRPRLTDEDRVFWIWVSRLFENWAQHLPS